MILKGVIIVICLVIVIVIIVIIMTINCTVDIVMPVQSIAAVVGKETNL